MRIKIRFACLAAFAVPFVAGVASAQGAGGSVSGSATVQVGGDQPPPAQPPPPVVYQPAPAPAPAPTYAAPPPPPPSSTYVIEPMHGGAYVHEGFYLRMAIGGGYVNATSSYDNGVPNITVKGGGLGFDLGIGGTVGRGVVIGGEYYFQQAVKPNVSDANGNDFGSSSANMNFGVLGPFIDWYPDPEQGFHFGGMLGVAVVTASDQSGNTKASDTGFGGGLGVGYDFWVAPEWSLGILGKLMGGTVQNSNQTIGTASTNEKVSVGAFSVLFSVLYN